MPPSSRVRRAASSRRPRSQHRPWREAIAATGAELLVLPQDESGRVSLTDLLTELGRRGVLSLLVEGGGVLHGSFFDQRLVDKVQAVIAPMIIGAGPVAVAGRDVERMADALRLRDVAVERLGEDVLVTGYVTAGHCVTAEAAADNSRFHRRSLRDGGGCRF